MINPVIKGTKVIFGPCRLSYTHLFAKYNPDNTEGGGKYQTNVLIPKGEAETIKAIKQAIEAAKLAGGESKWKGKKNPTIDLPIRDGDDKGDELYHGHWYMNAKCSTRPGVVDKNGSPIEDEDDVYSGMWAYVSVTFFPYSVSGKNGISAGLNNVKKYKDDERLGGRASAASDFDGIGESAEGGNDVDW